MHLWKCQYNNIRQILQILWVSREEWLRIKKTDIHSRAVKRFERFERFERETTPKVSSPSYAPWWGKERSSSGRHLKHRAEFQAGPSFTLRGADECRHRGLRAGQFWSTSLRSILKKWSLKVWSMRQGAGRPTSMVVLRNLLKSYVHSIL